MELGPKHFGLTKALWRQLVARRNKRMSVIGRDKFTRENNMPFYSEYNWLHPVQNFDYSFNSWGAREDFDYEQYYKKDVILCVGDSFTMNVGGPVYDSWPRILGEMLELPSINLGSVRFGPDTMYTVTEKMREYFNAKHIFIMYNLHGDESIDINPSDISSDVVEEKIKLLYNDIPFGAHVLFDPPWAGWTKEHLDILYRYYPDAHAYLKDIKFKYADIPYRMFECLTKNVYEEMKTPSWPKLDTIYFHLAEHNDLGDLLNPNDKYWFMHKIYPKCKNYFYRGRDYKHFSRLSNQMVADYFYYKVKGFYPAK